MRTIVVVPKRKFDVPVEAECLRPDLLVDEELKQIEERWEAEQDALRDTIARLQEELHDLEQRGRELRSAIDADKLALYDELLRSKGGVAVAVLKGDLCGVCRVRVPSGLAQRVRQGQEMVLCNNCGRILVKG